MKVKDVFFQSLSICEGQHVINDQRMSKRTSRKHFQKHMRCAQHQINHSFAAYERSVHTQNMHKVNRTKG